MAHERDHDLGEGLHALPAHVHRRFEDGAGLHLGDFRIHQSETASAEAEHRVEFVQGLDALLHLRGRNAELLGDFLLSLLVVREELVQGRIDGADGDRALAHGHEDAFEILALQRQELGERLPAAVHVLGEDHLAHRADLALTEEHVLGAAEADALGAEGNRVGGLIGLIGVGADVDLAHAVGPLHDLLVHLVHRGVLRIESPVDEHLQHLARARRDVAEHHLAGRAVDRDVIALADHFLAAVDAHLGGLVVDLQHFAARDADLAHLAGDQGRVRGHAAARGEDAFGGVHALDVFGRGLDADEDDRHAVLREADGVFGVEGDDARRRARTGVEALGEQLVFLDGLRLLLRVEDRAQELVELVRLDAHERLFLRDQLFLDHVHGDLDGGEGGALADAALQHVQVAVLDRELDVHHVTVMLLELLADVEQLFVRPGVLVLELDDGQRRARAGHHVLALRVHQELAVEHVLARGGVAREGHARAGVVTGVAEHHGLHVDRGAPFGGNAVELAVHDGALVHPGIEHGADRAPELLLGIVGEILPGLALDGGLELGDEFLEVLRVEIDVELHAARMLLRLEDFLEGVDVGLRLRLEIQHDVAVHLHETAVGIVCETLVARALDQSLHRGVVEAEVEDGVHHARHGRARARADGKKEGILRVAELRLHLAFDFPQRIHHLLLQHGRIGLLVVVVIGAHFGRDGESRGNGETDVDHFGEVGALAAEQVLHVGLAFGFLSAEEVHVLLSAGAALRGGGFGFRLGHGLLRIEIEKGRVASVMPPRRAVRPLGIHGINKYTKNRGTPGNAGSGWIVRIA